MPLIMENECKKNTFAAPAFVYLYPMHSVFISFSPFFLLPPQLPRTLSFLLSFMQAAKKL